MTKGKMHKPHAGLKTVTGNKLATIAFELYQGHIHLRAIANEAVTLSLLLDTGATMTLLNPDIASSLNLKAKDIDGSAHGAGTEAFQVKTLNDVTLDFSGLKAPFSELYLVPLGNVLSPYAGREIHGVLGYDFLSRFVIVIDYVKRLLHFFESGNYCYTGDGETLPLTLTNNLPQVRCGITVNGNSVLDANIIFDTGGGGLTQLILTSPFVGKHGLLESDISTVPDLIVGAGGPVPARTGRIPGLRIGNRAHNGVLTQFSQPYEGDQVGAFCDGIIGAGILRKYMLVWDYASEKLILEPNRNYDMPFADAVTGMVLRSKGEGFREVEVQAVAQSSPAALAGIEPLDRILSVDEKDVSGLDIDKLEALFYRGQVYHLSVLRGDNIIEIEFSPKILA